MGILGGSVGGPFNLRGILRMGGGLCKSDMDRLLMDEQLTKRLKDIFFLVDDNHNGVLEPGELFKFCGGNKELAAELMLGLDADGDGEVNMDEWLTYFAERLDNEGIEELEEFLQSMEKNLKGKGDYKNSSIDDFDVEKSKQKKKKKYYA